MEQIPENPYLQYFTGLPRYQDTSLYDASTRVLFRKRITADMLCEANEYLLAHKKTAIQVHHISKMIQIKTVNRTRRKPTNDLLLSMLLVPLPTLGTLRISPC